MCDESATIKFQLALFIAHSAAVVALLALLVRFRSQFRLQLALRPERSRSTATSRLLKLLMPLISKQSSGKLFSNEFHACEQLPILPFGLIWFAGRSMSLSCADV